MSAVSLKNIESTLKGHRCVFTHLKITDDIFEGVVTTNHFTKANYYRLLIPKLISEDKILYLDADIVVKGSIDSLYESDIKDYYIGAIENPGFTRHNELKMDIRSKYFNSGVMLMNLKKWRSSELANKVIEFVENNPKKIEFVDQCGLNSIINGAWMEFSPKYNQQSVIFEENFVAKYNCFNSDELDEALKAPVIIHYTGSSKPWHLRNKHPYKYLYWRYLMLTPYKYSVPTDMSFLNILKFIFPEFCKNYLRSIFK